MFVYYYIIFMYISNCNYTVTSVKPNIFLLLLLTKGYVKFLLSSVHNQCRLNEPERFDEQTCTTVLYTNSWEYDAEKHLVKYLVYCLYEWACSLPWAECQYGCQHLIITQAVYVLQPPEHFCTESYMDTDCTVGSVLFLIVLYVN